MSEQPGSGASGREAAVGASSPVGEPLASSSSSVGPARRLSAIRDALGEDALRLAYHAAVPVVVDADLLNLLRVNFFLDDPPDILPFEIEAELLLSPLFREIGEGLYEIDPGLRNLLLSGLHTRYGDERVRRVAALLERYTDAAAAWRSLPELELAQRLTALSFLDPAGAERWLDVHEASAAQQSSSSAASADDGPGRAWYVAMRRRVAENSDITTIDTEIRYAGEALLRLLSYGDISARMSVIRSLESLASLPETDADEVVAVLCAFIQKWGQRSPSPSKRVTLDVQAALSLIGSLPHIEFRLEGVALTGADLAGLDFSYAIFDRVVLTELDARVLDLTYAQFNDVILSDANLDGAFLDEAFLEFHTLRNVSLKGVSREGAYIAANIIQGVTGSHADGTPLEIRSLSAEEEAVGFPAELGRKEEPAAAAISTMQLYLPSSPQPVGIAFFVSRDGLAVTALHSIERESRITARINETSLDANLVYADRVNDVALIKLDISDAVPLALLHEIPAVSEDVVILSPTAGPRRARVTSFGLSVLDLDDDSSPARIYIDELIGNGESGSVIVNSSGLAIGMLVRRSTSASPVQFTAAVPAARIAKDIERYQAKALPSPLPEPVPGSPGAPVGQRPSGLRPGTVGLPAGQRYLGIECPEVIPVGNPLALLVRIAMASGGTGGGTGGGTAALKPFSVPPGGLDVLLVLSAPGMRLLADSRSTVRVPADGDSEPVIFELNADAPGLYTISVTAWLAGTFLGQGIVEVTAERDRRMTSTRYSAAQTAVEPEVGAVSLVVRFDPQDRSCRFEFRDEDNPGEVVSRLVYEPQRYVEHAMASLSELTRSRNYSATEVREYLVSTGIELWRELLPERVRDQFWERQQRIRDLRILADTDIIPWELLYPMDHGYDAGFLVEQFPVTRAIFGRRPVRRLGLRPARFVLPEGSSPAAEREVAAVQRLLGAGESPGGVISELTPLLDLIRSGDFGLLHLESHNNLDSESGSLPLGNQQFSPLLMTTLAINQVLAESAPIIFLSTRRSPGSPAAYNRLSEWASTFLRAGAGAFIAPQWTVYDDAAYAFAREFYGELLTGNFLGSAVMRARQSAATQSDDASWLAFTVYGDPRARIIDP
jgi:uncharacterized protein YjbI with pentapeptide repeats